MIRHCPLPELLQFPQIPGSIVAVVTTPAFRPGQCACGADSSRERGSAGRYRSVHQSPAVGKGVLGVMRWSNSCKPAYTTKSLLSPISPLIKRA
jgi:hypothetical protein